MDDTLDHIYRCTIQNRHVNEKGKLRKDCSINVSLDCAAFDMYAESIVFLAICFLFFLDCENEAKHKQARSKKSRERKKKSREN